MPPFLVGLDLTTAHNGVMQKVDLHKLGGNMNRLDVANNYPSQRQEFLATLMAECGVTEKQHWQNNNGTVSQTAYVVDVKEMDEVATIIAKLFAYNQSSQERPLLAVPVAGWHVDDASCLSFQSSRARKKQLVAEYAKSFSLSPFTTAEQADVILRVSKAAQRIEVFENERGQRFLRVTAGVRITDAEQFLAARRLAFRPNMPTLQMASLVGAASNGSYGPAKNYRALSTNIIEMKVIAPTGQPLNLSAKENGELFAVLRDCHMGAGFFVSEMTLKNIEPDFSMKRTDLLFKDAEEFALAMEEKNLLNKPHWIMHYFPNERFRVTTFERTLEAPSAATQPQKHLDVADYVNLVETNAGEPLINHIVASKRLRPFFPLVLKVASIKTFGTEKERVEIDNSSTTVHILRTYTESPITDINWLIQVKDGDAARELLVGLMQFIEGKLQALALREQYPLLTIYARFLKGIYYPAGEGGVAPTAVDHSGQSVLSFELLSYAALQKTKGYKFICQAVIKYLNAQGCKYKYHPGKTWPEHLSSLTELFTDAIDQQRLANFQRAIIELHGGVDQLPFSPLLTPQKKRFIGLDSTPSPGQSAQTVNRVTSQQRKGALLKILELAEEHEQDDLHVKAHGLLKGSH
jgi:hypothetical protein